MLNALYVEWLNNLLAYEQEIEHLEGMLDEFRISHHTAGIDGNYCALMQDLQHHKTEVKSLADQIVEKRKKLVNSSGVENVVPLSAIIENNNLRDKLRKTEHAVFYSKYLVNKFLSIAS